MSTDYLPKIYQPFADMQSNIVQLNNAASESLSRGQPQLAFAQITEAHYLWKTHVANNLEMGATVLYGFGNVLHDLGRFSEALTRYAECQFIERQIYGETPCPEVASTLHGIGTALASLERYKEALDHHMAALKIKQMIYKAPHFSIATTIQSIAYVLHYMGRQNHALMNCKDALLMFRQVYRKPHHTIAGSLINLGGILSIQGDYDEALQVYNEALEICDKIYTKPHPSVSAAFLGIGNVSMEMGHYETALEKYEQSFSLAHQIHGENHLLTLTSKQNIATALSSLGRHESALETYKEILESLHQIEDEPMSQIATALYSIGVEYWSLKDYEKSLEYYIKSLNLFLKIHEGPHPDVARVRHGIGTIFWSLKQYKDALEYHKKALEMFKKIYKGSHINIITSLHAIGNIFFDSGKHSQAITYYMEALELDRTIYGESPRDIRVSLLSSLGRTHMFVNQPKKTIPILLKSLDMHIDVQHTLSGVLNVSEIMKNNLEKHEGFRTLFHCAENLRQSVPRIARTWISFKGTAGALDTSMQLLVHRYPHLKPLYETLLEAKRSVVAIQAALTNSLNVQMTSPKAVKAARTHLEQAESALRKEARSVFDFQNLTLDQVLSALEPGETYVDYALVYGQAFAFVAHQGGSKSSLVRLVDLGSVDALEREVAALRHDLIPPEGLHEAWRPLSLEKFRQANHAAAELYERLIRPLNLGSGVESGLVISPDGALNFVPFDLLYDSKLGQFLLEQQTVRLIPSARDLVRLHTAQYDNTSEGAILLGHPDYLATTDEIKAALKQDFREQVASRLHPNELLLEFAVLRSGEGEAVSVLVVRKNGAENLSALAVTQFPDESGGFTLLSLAHLRSLLEPGKQGQLVQVLIDYVLDMASNVWPEWSDPQRISVLTSSTFPRVDLAALRSAQGQGRALSESHNLTVHGSLTTWLAQRLPGVDVALEFDTLHASLGTGTDADIYQGGAWSDYFVTRSSGLMGGEQMPFSDVPNPEKAPERGAHPSRLTLTPLPQTLPQVLAIAHTLTKLEPRVFVGPAASLLTLRAALEKRAPLLLHLTTHGEQLTQSNFQLCSLEVRDRLFDPLHRSYLLLAGAEHANRHAFEGEGLLSAFTLATLELRGTRLVVLAACETQMGEALAAEGVSGLAQGAFLGGAQAVLGSLWKVEVGATTALMLEFYARWQDGGQVKPHRALSALKRKWLSHPHYSAPFYWSAFTLSGR